MAEELEDDHDLYQLFNLADKHNWTINQVLEMSLEEYWGWWAYHKLQGDLKKET
jgi:hypothetical protein